MNQRYVVDVTAAAFSPAMLSDWLEKVIRQYVSDWFDYDQDVSVKVTRVDASS